VESLSTGIPFDDICTYRGRNRRLSFVFLHFSIPRISFHSGGLRWDVHGNFRDDCSGLIVDHCKEAVQIKSAHVHKLNLLDGMKWTTPFLGMNRE